MENQFLVLLKAAFVLPTVHPATQVSDRVAQHVHKRYTEWTQYVHNYFLKENRAINSDNNILNLFFHCVVLIVFKFQAMTASSPWDRRMCFSLPFYMRVVMCILRMYNIGGDPAALTHLILQVSIINNDLRVNKYIKYKNLYSIYRVFLK